MFKLPNIVLFDLDGTIIDNTEIIVKIYKKIAEDLGYHGMDDKTISDLGGKSTFETGRGMGIKDEDLDYVDKYFWIYFQEFCKNLNQTNQKPILLDRMTDLIEYLKKNKIQLGIVTSNERKSAETLLSLVELNSYFDVYVGREDSTKPKPSPEPLFYALSKLGIKKWNKEEIWYIGDTESDMKAAKTANVTSFHIGTKSIRTKPDYKFESSTALYETITLNKK
jgi:HAD superfamily hydrolase (TIGR01549 family)